VQERGGRGDVGVPPSRAGRAKGSVLLRARAPRSVASRLHRDAVHPPSDLTLDAASGHRGPRRGAVPGVGRSWCPALEPACGNRETSPSQASVSPTQVGLRSGSPRLRSPGTRLSHDVPAPPPPRVPEHAFRAASSTLTGQVELWLGQEVRNRARHPTDRTFASRCSPPRLAATELRSAMSRRASAQKGPSPLSLCAIEGARDAGLRRLSHGWASAMIGHCGGVGQP